MNGNLEISVDKLPVKRLEAIEENGAERFPLDVGYDEKRESLIRRIDFAWAVEKDESKKQKKSSKEGGLSATTTPWQWQNMVENLQLAHQELSVVIDLINTLISANHSPTYTAADQNPQHSNPKYTVTHQQKLEQQMEQQQGTRPHRSSSRPQKY